VNLNQVTLPSIDVAASIDFYRMMGFELIVRSPHYARFKSVEGDASFSVHLTEQVTGSLQTVVYFECDKLDEQVRKLKSKGLQFFQEPNDEPWLWREARLLDPSGNIICLYYAGENRLNPPWRVRDLETTAKQQHTL
jgi:predicted enzyme related to lactoylglutathione lyase